jgi:hypothetical protein
VGKGIDAARPDAPLHAAVLDDFKDQLLIAFIRRLGGKISIPVKEVDETGSYVVSFNIENGAFNFVMEKKQ